MKRLPRPTKYSLRSRAQSCFFMLRGCCCCGGGGARKKEPPLPPNFSCPSSGSSHQQHQQQPPRRQQQKHVHIDRTASWKNAGCWCCFYKFAKFRITFIKFLKIVGFFKEPNSPKTFEDQMNCRKNPTNFKAVYPVHFPLFFTFYFH